MLEIWDMMMKMKNEDEMQNMFDIVNQIRETDYPNIPKELVEKILKIERKNLGDRDKSLSLIKDEINKYIPTDVK